MALQIADQPPLQGRDPTVAHPRVERPAEQPCGVVQQEADRLVPGSAYNSNCSIIKRTMRGSIDNCHSGVNCSEYACPAPHFRQDEGTESLRRHVLVLTLALFLLRDRQPTGVG